MGTSEEAHARELLNDLSMAGIVHSIAVPDGAVELPWGAGVAVVHAPIMRQTFPRAPKAHALYGVVDGVIVAAVAGYLIDAEGAGQ